MKAGSPFVDGLFRASSMWQLFRPAPAPPDDRFLLPFVSTCHKRRPTQPFIFRFSVHISVLSIFDPPPAGSPVYTQ